MPKSLRQVHNKLDKYVLESYGLSGQASDAEILEKLFVKYQEMINIDKL
jgi:hypothetical protein